MEYVAVNMLFMVINGSCSNGRNHPRDVAATAEGVVMNEVSKDQSVSRQQSVAELLKYLELLVGRVEFGKVELIFHQGRLVQLEKSEKLRVD